MPETSSSSALSTDEILVQKAQQGDKRAFDALVIKYQYRVMALIGRYIQDPHDVMDVAQDSFIKAYRSLAQFRGDSAFYTWLYRIAVNSAKNQLATRIRKPPHHDVQLDNDDYYSQEEIALADMTTPDALLNRDRLESSIYQVIRALPEELRMAITLREFDGLSYDEIALIMDCPIGTVRSRIFRARDAIEQHIRPYLHSND